MTEFCHHCDGVHAPDFECLPKQLIRLGVVRHDMVTKGTDYSSYEALEPDEYGDWVPWEGLADVAAAIKAEGAAQRHAQWVELVRTKASAYRASAAEAENEEDRRRCVDIAATLWFELGEDAAFDLEMRGYISKEDEARIRAEGAAQERTRIDADGGTPCVDQEGDRERFMSEYEARIRADERRKTLEAVQDVATVGYNPTLDDYLCDELTKLEDRSLAKEGESG